MIVSTPPEEIESEVPGALPLAKLISALNRLGDDGFGKEYGDAFFLLHRLDLTKPQVLSDTVADLSANAQRESQGDSGFLALAISKNAENAFPHITIGRTANNDIVITDATVSKFHAYLQSDAGSDEYVVYDAGSKNGCFLNDVPVPEKSAGDPLPLGRKATLRVGSVPLTFVRISDLHEFAKFLVPSF